MEKSNWTQNFYKEIEGMLENVISSWEEIGFTDGKLYKKREDLKLNLFSMLQTMIEEEQLYKSEIIVDIENLKRDINSLESDLEIPSASFPEGNSLLWKKSYLTEIYNKLNKQAMNLRIELQSLLERQCYLCKKMGTSEMNSSEKGFINLISKIKENIAVLENEKSKRITLLTNLKGQLEDFLKELGNEYQTRLPDSVQKFLDSSVIDWELSEDFISIISDLSRKLEIEFRIKKDQEIEIFDKISTLRSRLSLPPFNLSTMHGSLINCRIQHGCTELERLIGIRREKLPALIQTCLIELNDTWDECFINKFYRAEFLQNNATLFPEEQLSALECEISNWKGLKNSNHSFYGTLQKWSEIKQRIHEIELQRQDPNVLKNRGGVLLKLEKELRRLTQKDFPHQNLELQQAIDSIQASVEPHIFMAICVSNKTLSELSLDPFCRKENVGSNSSLANWSFEFRETAKSAVSTKRMPLKNSTPNTVLKNQNKCAPFSSAKYKYVTKR